MSKIHHTQRKFAEAHGLGISVTESGAFVVTIKATGEEHIGEDLKALLATCATETKKAIKPAKAKAAPKAKKPAKAKAAPASEDGDEEEVTGPSNSGVMGYSYYKQYRANGGSCGDGLAESMAGFCQMADTGKTGKANRTVTDLERVLEVANENGIDAKAKWGHLNNGMVRMNLSNVLRARLAKGEKVTVNGKRVRAD
jgi:hypothetical protein